MNYRILYFILYFFHGQQGAILAHGLIKKGEIPEADLPRTRQQAKRGLGARPGTAYV